jgi:hypothetical protein
MLIFWKERLVFLANTKTGSTSIEAALEQLAHVAIRRPPQLKHIRARSFNQHFRPLLHSKGGGSFTTIALMRDPVDWLGSWFRYRQRDDLGEAAPSTAGIDFPSFVEAYLSPAPPDFANVGSQAGFLGDAKGNLLVDRVFRYEALDSFVHFLEDTLGCAITLPHINVSPKAPLDLPGPLRDRLMQAFAADYAIYNSLP